MLYSSDDGSKQGIDKRRCCLPTIGLSRQSPKGSCQSKLVSYIPRENNDGHVWKATVVGGTSHNTAAGHDLAQHPRGFEGEALAQNIVARDSTLADQKAERGREISHDVHEQV
jgi:hypothetical protein